MKLRPISLDELDNLQIDEDTNELYWRNNKVVISNKVSLRWLELTLAILVTIGTLLSGIAATIELCT